MVLTQTTGGTRPHFWWLFTLDCTASYETQSKQSSAPTVTTLFSHTTTTSQSQQVSSY